MTAVYFAWDKYDHRSLEKAFCTLMTNYDQIICHEGSNRYKTKHIGKEGIWNSQGVHALCKEARQASPDALHMFDLMYGNEH